MGKDSESGISKERRAKAKACRSPRCPLGMGRREMQLWPREWGWRWTWRGSKECVVCSQDLKGGTVTGLLFSKDLPGVPWPTSGRRIKRRSQEARTKRDYSGTGRDLSRAAVERTRK